MNRLNFLFTFCLVALPAFAQEKQLPPEEAALYERFLRYIAIDTQSDENSQNYPSSPGQLVLGKLLVDELKALGLQDASQDEAGIVMATLPASKGFENISPFALISHLDTTPDASGKNIQPILHFNYDGKPIVLPKLPNQPLDPKEHPELQKRMGHTIITSDGSSILAADDKAGVASIMEAISHLIKNPQIPHGPIRIVFLCDEEIGKSTDKLKIENVGAVGAYTIDGDGIGIVDSENFSARSFEIVIEGVNTHPGRAKDNMVNALLLQAEFISKIPEELSPAKTEGREGFIHPISIAGDVAKVTIKGILRDFEHSKLADFEQRLKKIAEDLNAKNPKAKLNVSVKFEYDNMAEGIRKSPRIIAVAKKAIQAVGLEPNENIIRGGTDGADLTAKGLPTPNLSAGGHNFHSLLEWASLQDIVMCTKTLVALAQIWATEK